MSNKIDKKTREAYEKRLIRDYFDHKTGGFFVDVGANDPTDILSQSWHLETQLTWKGILIEPNPSLAKRCGELRRGSTTFGCACVDTENHDQITLYIPLRDGKEIDVHAGIGKNIDDFNYTNHTEVRVDARTLNSILEETKVDEIDLLSIDVEGAELQVLKGLDINKYKPKLILLEDKHMYLTKHRYLRKHGYSLVKRTGFNFWYAPEGAKRPHQDLKEKLKLWKRMYISIWWKKLRYSIRHSTLKPFQSL